MKNAAVHSHCSFKVVLITEVFLMYLRSENFRWPDKQQVSFLRGCVAHSHSAQYRLFIEMVTENRPVFEVFLSHNGIALISDWFYPVFFIFRIIHWGRHYPNVFHGLLKENVFLALLWVRENQLRSGVISQITYPLPFFLSAVVLYGCFLQPYLGLPPSERRRFIPLP